MQRVNSELRDTLEREWDVSTDGLPPMMTDLSPHSRFDNASKGPEDNRPGRSKDNLYKWIECKYSYPNEHSIDMLLQPLEELPNHDVGYVQGGRKWDMGEVKRHCPQWIALTSIVCERNTTH